ncbi:ArsB/NhaD family transporter [Thermotoga caldifontis]|uniref:SLC13 family permease n=1 Tax=Thermotoga caldifontis TaxID=1508419 RepID=UPI00059706C8|nr:SLC13 family permease [Thermotoga caldifontis]
MVDLVITLNIFFATVYATIKEPKIKIKNAVISLDQAKSSLLALILLIATGVVPLTLIRTSLMKQLNIVPWQILVIFFGSAYICTSLDASGLLKVIAYKFLSLSKGDGKKLFFNTILLAGIMTMFTSNDIVTLTLTPIIVYMSQYSGMDPIPLLISVFFTSNTWSMFFYIGNPTNVIVAQAYSFSFFEYARLMFIPTIAAIAASLVGFYVQYRKKIPQRVEARLELDIDEALKSKLYAWLSGLTFCAFFVTVSIGDFIGLPLWKAVVLYCAIYALLNLAFSGKMSKANFEDSHSLSFFIDVFKRVPWKILPMIITFFVFVQTFSMYGLTDLVGKLFNFRNDLLVSFFTTYVTAFAANIMINQPMTIFFAHALWQKPISYALSLVVGSNIGGNITLIGALAGMMWSRILKNYGIEMNNVRFIKNTFFVAMLTLIASSFGIWISVRFLH